MEKKDELRHKIIIAVRKFGDVQVCKVGHVFTLLITGEQLANARTVMQIGNIVGELTADDYPIVEVFKNDDNFLLMVYKPEIKTL